MFTKNNSNIRLQLIIGVCGIFYIMFPFEIVSGQKIIRRKPIVSENKENSTHKKSPSRRRSPSMGGGNIPQKIQKDLQKNMTKMQEVIQTTKHMLKSFETLLDKINTVITQKIQSQKIKNPLKAQTAIKHIVELRNMLFSIRSTLTERAPQNLLELPQFINGIGMHLYLSIHTAEYIEKLIKNRFKKFQPFDLMRFVMRGQKMAHHKNITKNIRLLNKYINNIDSVLNDFDITITNKVARFIDAKLVSPFFKYSLDTISLYGLGGGILGVYLIAWKGITGWYTKYKDIQFLIGNGSLTDDMQNNLYQRTLKGEIIGVNNEIKNILTDPKKGIFVTEKIKGTDNLIATGYNPKYKETWNYLQKFGQYLKNKFGDPEEKYTSYHGIYYPEVGKYFDSNYRALLGKGKETKLTTFDREMTKYLANAYPLVSIPLGLVAPTLWESWTKTALPTIKGNVNAFWNKLLGGVFEERAIEGNFEISAHHTLDDVIGMEDKVEELKLLIQYLINPERYSHMKGKITKAFLLTGETRTGKTFLVEAFVGSLQKALQQAGRSPNSIITFNLPVSAIQQYGISGILKHIKTKAPAVVFIDEVDLIGLQRNTNTTVLSDFLTGMTPLLDEDPTKTVVLFCATNKAETLDKALRTVGRFGKEIRFDYPPFRNRKQFLERELKRLGINIKDIDFDRLARQLDQVPYEKINYILHNAMMQASIKGERFSQHIFEKTIDTEVREIITKNRKDLDPEEKEIYATHFAAHILCFLLLKMATILDSITIQATQPKTGEDFVGADQFRKDDDKPKKIVFGATFANKNGDSEDVMTPELLLNTIKQLLSGFIAEEIIYGGTAYSCHPEFSDEAFKKALHQVSTGIKLDKLPEKQKEMFTDKALELLEQCKQELRILFTEHKDLLLFMSKALLKRETLSGTEIQELYEAFSERNKKQNEKDAQEDIIDATTTEENPAEDINETPAAEESTKEVVSENPLEVTEQQSEELPIEQKDLELVSEEK